MQQLIEAFPKQLKEALEIGRKAQLKAPGGPCQRGRYRPGWQRHRWQDRRAARAEGGQVPHRGLPQLLPSGLCEPQEPGLIACSYSGNTEETIAAMEQALNKGARVVVVTSGGTMLEMAKAKGLDHIVIPGKILHAPCWPIRWCSSSSSCTTSASSAMVSKGAIKTAADQLERDKEDIKKAAMDLTEKLMGKRLAIYSEANTEAVSIRFRQQVNEK